MNCERLVKRLQHGADELLCLPPSDFFCNGTIRSRAEWLLNAEAERHRILNEAVEMWVAETHWPDLTPADRFLLWGRMASSTDFISKLLSMQLGLTLDVIMAMGGKAFVEQLLINGWPSRMESWWMRFVARLETDLTFSPIGL